jgi:hypothetical protein
LANFIDLLPIGRNAAEVHQDGAFLTGDMGAEKPGVDLGEQCASGQFVEGLAGSLEKSRDGAR